MNSKIKAVLFDLDETILDRTRSLKDFLLWQAKGTLRNSIVDASHYCARFIELYASGTVSKVDVYTQLIGEYDINDWSVEELLSSYELCFSGFCKARDGAVEAITTLKTAGFKIGLVSNGRSPFQIRSFNALGINDMFDAVIVSAAVGYRKPQKEIFELACERIGVSVSETIFVGDNPEADIRGANACGMYTIYTPGPGGGECEAADVTCQHFSQLLHLVEKRAGKLAL